MTQFLPTVVDTTPKIASLSLLRAGRVLWAAVFLVSLLTFVASLPVLWDQFRTPSLEVSAGLADLGVSPEVLAVYKLGAQILASLAFFTLSIFLVLRLSHERIGLLTAIFFAAFGTPLGSGAPTVSLAIGGVFLPTLMYALGWSSVWLAVSIFPDGRFVPRWAVIPVLLGIITIPFWLQPTTSPFLVNNWSPILQALLTLVTYGGMIFARIYRRRYFSSLIQQQQSKWVIFIFSQVGVFILINSLVPTLFPSMNEPGIPAVIRDVLKTIPILVSALIPVTVMFAIVRYRLWDVDLLINRSLVYGAVTLLLLVVFGVGTIIIGRVVEKSVSGIALPISAIVVGLLFNPTRKWMQSFIDHRLYRFKYDLNELSAAQKKPQITNTGALTGKKLGGYEVLGLLGKGGMGEVYAGYQEGQTVALKILPAALSERSELVSRFEREAKAMQRLTHPHIVKLLSSGVEGEIRYLVLEFIDGTDLSHFLKEHGEFSFDETQRLLQPLAQALDYAHSLGIIHRDIKPSNVMLREGILSQAVLMDFGIAKLDSSQSRLTESGAIGTIDFMAPEQIIAAKEVDHRADIYALGVLTYQMLSAETPFKGNVGQIVFAHINQPAPSISNLKPELPGYVGAAIQRAMAKDPAERFDSAGAFIRALNAAPRMSATEPSVLATGSKL